MDPASKKAKIEVVPAGTGSTSARFETLDVKLSACGVLNAANTSDLPAVLAKQGHDGSAAALRSDCDEQLLVTVELAQPAKVHSIRVTAPSKASAPSQIKLFLNKTALSFDDVEDLKPAQVVSVTGPEQTIPLQFVKFQNVCSLTFFIEGNQGDEDVTCLSRLELIGTPLSTTNMSELKKGG